MNEKALAIREEFAVNYADPEMVKTLKATVAQGLNDAEFVMFAQHCKATGLNPFKKEVWAIKGKSYINKRGERIEGKVQIMTGINGFHTIANANPSYDGLETGLIDKNGDYKTQAYPGNDYIGAWCKVYRKDRRMPVEAVAMLLEYDKSAEVSYDSIWKKMKRVMITKCAESVALRKAFPQELNGLYTSEEMPQEFAPPAPLKLELEGEGRAAIDVTPGAKKAAVMTADELQKAQEIPVGEIYTYKLPFVSKEKYRELIARGFTRNPNTGLWAGPEYLEEFSDCIQDHGYNDQSDTEEASV